MDTMKSALARAHYRELGLQEACAHCKLQHEKKDDIKQIYIGERKREREILKEHGRDRERRNREIRQHDEIVPFWHAPPSLPSPLASTMLLPLVLIFVFSPAIQQELSVNLQD
jgi:hypothetical protein